MITIYLVVMVIGFCYFYSLMSSLRARSAWQSAVNSSLRAKGVAIQSFNYKNFLLFLILITFTLIHCPSYAHPSFDVNNGLKALESGDLDTAESDLQKARFEEPDSYIINYDLGIVSYRKRDYAKSIRFFAKASEVSKTVDERFDSFYNMGNAAFKAYDFALAVDAYKNALSIKKNYQAEYNLEVAEKKLKEMLERMKKEQEQQQQQNQQQNQDNKQNQKEEQKKDNSQKPDSNNSQNQKDNQSQKQQEQQNQDNQGQQGQQNQQNQQDQQSQQNKQDQKQSSENNSERNQQASEYDDNKSQDDKQQEGQNSNKSEENKEESKEEQKQASNSKDKDSENQQNQENQDNQEKQNSGEKNEQAENQNNQKEQSAQSSEEQKENDAQKEDNQKEAQTPINEEKIAPEEDRRDIKMAEDKGKVSRPEASKKARDLKKRKLTARDYKDIEQILKTMEANENEYQKYYRINNIEDKNPAYMDPEELKEWIKVRTKKRERQTQGQQDW